MYYASFILQNIKINNGEIELCYLFSVSSRAKCIKPHAVPSLNLPRKSHPPSSVKARRPIKKVSSIKKDSTCYSSLTDVYKKLFFVKYFSDWTMEYGQERLVLSYFTPPDATPKYQLVIDESLSYCLTIYGWRLPDDHLIYRKYRRSVKHVTLCSLIEFVKSFQICRGLTSATSLVAHCIPQMIDPFSESRYFLALQHKFI